MTKGTTKSKLVDRKFFVLMWDWTKAAGENPKWITNQDELNALLAEGWAIYENPSALTNDGSSGSVVLLLTKEKK